MKNKLKLIALIIIAILLLGACGWTIYSVVNAKNSKIAHPVASFEIENYGTVDIELYPEYAPNTVTNFIALINAGYYNNKILYGKDDICVYMGRSKEEDKEAGTTTDGENYVMTVPIGEDATSEENSEESSEEKSEEENNEYTKPMASIFDSSIEKDSDQDYEYEINGEFVSNGFNKNTLRHEKGVISLNRSDYSAYGLKDESYNSGQAQFSIIMEDTPSLNGFYSGFGKIVNGYDIIEKIYSECPIKEKTEEETDTSAINEFSEYPVIRNATVETYGVDYGKPEIHEAFDFNAYINNLYLQYYQQN